MIDKARNKIDKINELLVFAKKNKKIIFLYPKKLRRKLYNDGISVKYVSKKRTGEIVKEENVHYKMLFRNTGKAKKCMYIYM